MPDRSHILAAAHTYELAEQHYRFCPWDLAVLQALVGSFGEARQFSSCGVRNLEHLVGADLFERDDAGIRPTAAGNWFLDEATPWL